MAVEPILAVRDLRKHFGSLKVLGGVNLELQQGSRHAVIGPNGSGKSTLLMTIAGALRASSGTISLAGTDVSRWSVTRRAREGIAVKFQAPRVFPDMSVVDNVRLATRGRSSLLRQLVSRDRLNLDTDVTSVLHRTRLAGLAHQRAGTLSHGHQQWLELAMALAVRPRVVLLDEPAAGMTTDERAATADILRGLGTEVSILLIEHDFAFVQTICDTVTVLDGGSVLASGTPSEVARDETVRSAYANRLLR